MCCSGAGLAGEVARLVLSGIAVHLKLCVRLLLFLLQCVALHLQSVFGAQRPVEEQAGYAHLPSRLSGAVRPHGRGRYREVSVPVLGLTGDGWSPGFGIMSRVDRFAVILREASVKRIQQRQLGRGDH